MRHNLLILIHVEEVSVSKKSLVEEMSVEEKFENIYSDQLVKEVYHNHEVDSSKEAHQPLSPL